MKMGGTERRPRPVGKAGLAGSPLLSLESKFSFCSSAWHWRLSSIGSVLELEFYRDSGLSVLCTCFLVAKLFSPGSAYTQPLSSRLGQAGSWNG